MNLFSTLSDRMALRCGLAAACAWLAFAGAATLARGQCSPQELAKLIASDAAAGAQFGYSVAVSGDTAVVGANGAGSAYVFVRSGTIWVQQAKLTASDAAAGQFGSSVSISGDTVVVGADFDDLYAGSAYVFVKPFGGWTNMTETAKLTASDAAEDDQFGFAIALNDNTLVVGSVHDNYADFGHAGSAYVFVRAGGFWTQQAMLTAADAASFDEFGWSVAASGDTVVVGARGNDHDGATDAGSAYVFVRSGGAWTQQAKLTASDAAAGDQFGRSVAVSSETVVVGAPFDDHVSGTDAGSAYVFVKPPGGWTNMTETAKLSASDGAPSDEFGHSVAISGATVVVGSYLDSHAGGTNAGSAYVFVKPPGGWTNMTETAKLTASDAAASDWFGVSVAVSGNTALVAAAADDNVGGINAGSAYVFLAGADSDCDGVLDANDVCQNNAPGLLVDCTGRPLRDANNDCLVNTADVPLIVDEILSVTIPPTGCNGRPLRDTNGDAAVNGADVQQIVKELLIP